MMRPASSGASPFRCRTTRRSTTRCASRCRSRRTRSCGTRRGIRCRRSRASTVPAIATRIGDVVSIDHASARRARDGEPARARERRLRAPLPSRRLALRDRAAQRARGRADDLDRGGRPHLAGGARAPHGSRGDGVEPAELVRERKLVDEYISVRLLEALAGAERGLTGPHAVEVADTPRASSPVVAAVEARLAEVLSRGARVPRGARLRQRRPDRRRRRSSATSSARAA